MTGLDLKTTRKKRGWTQVEAAMRLGISQAYLSLLENGARPFSLTLRKRLVATLGLSPVALPFRAKLSVSEDRLAQELGTLGYPGFRHLRAPQVRWNPADLLLAALLHPHLDSRLAEALPWFVRRFADLDWERVVGQAKLLDLQNRLGFVVTLARQLAERQEDSNPAATLRKVESMLHGSLLARTDSLSRLTNAERRWLETERPPEAKQWNVLSDLSVEHLTHAS